VVAGNRYPAVTVKNALSLPRAKPLDDKDGASLGDLGCGAAFRERACPARRVRDLLLAGKRRQVRHIFRSNHFEQDGWRVLRG